MYRLSLALAILLVPISFLCAFSPTASVTQSSKFPFAVSWTAGSCANCQVVKSVGEFVLTGASTIWAKGYFAPTAAGNYSVIQSVDSGRHWIEIPETRMYAAEPSFTFFDSKTGLISQIGSDGAAWVRQTNDGGHHWTQVSDHFIQNMQLVSDNVAVGDEFNGTVDRFAKTTDGGHTWMLSDLPGLKLADKIRFLTPEVGWIAGTNEVSDRLDDRTAVVLRTTDGGQHWASFQISSRTAVADIQDMFFLNESLGWLITWGFNDDGTHLYFTSDGGKTWRVHPDETIQGPGEWLSVVRFIGSKIGFAFYILDEAGAPKHLGRLLFTDDGGEHWRTYAFDAVVQDCEVSGRGLRCSASRGKSAFEMFQIGLPIPK